MPQDIKTVITNQIKQDINENIKDDIVLKAKFFKMIYLQTKNGDNNMFPKLLVYLSCMSENRNANISKENIDSLVSLVENNNILEFKEKLEIITNYNFVSEAITKSKEFYYNFVYNKKDIDEFFDNLGSLTELNEQFTSFINKNYYFDYKEKTFKQSSQNWTEEKGCEFLRNSEVLTKLNNNNNFLKATIVNEIKNDSSSILLTTNDKLPKDSLSIVTKNKVVKNNVSCFTKELVNKRRAVPQSKLKKVVSLDEIDNLFDKYIKSVSDYANLYESVGKTLSKLYLQYQSEDNFKLFFENEKIGSNLNELGKNEIKKLYQIWNKDYSHKTNDELLMTTSK
ncbi:hypothetical protein [Spiroplasma endosymbiont of Dilophus febrilis]|uniref:hypothetical protein n=1 Tax=Spiroplasma endosymbiont of Dilophus febrilis TaxID=3066292 RepID=UPI00313BAC0D